MPTLYQARTFEEALHDTTAILTYCALPGIQKQKMQRLFGLPLITWIKSKGYNDEATYLRVIHNWRYACDDRGLSDESSTAHLTRKF